MIERDGQVCVFPVPRRPSSTTFSPFSARGEVFGDDVVATTMIDRLSEGGKGSTNGHYIGRHRSSCVEGLRARERSRPGP